MNRRRLPVAGVSSAVRSAEKEESPRCGVPTIEDADSPSSTQRKNSAAFATELYLESGERAERQPGGLSGIAGSEANESSETSGMSAPRTDRDD